MDELIDKTRELLASYWKRVDATEREDHHTRRLALNRLNAEFNDHGIDETVRSEFSRRLAPQG